MLLEVSSKEVLNQIDDEVLLDYVSENFSFNDIADKYCSDNIDDYIWESGQKKPFDGAYIYCIYYNEEGKSVICEALYKENKYTNIYNNENIRDIIGWMYKPYFL